MSLLFDWKLQQTKPLDGGISFRSLDKTVTITYQRKYETEWWKKKQERFMQDRPDIVIEFKSGKVLVLDAKNSDLASGTSYREQIESYMRTAGNEKADYGMLVFSKGEKKDWEEAAKGSQKVYWRTLTPKNEDLNLETIDEIIQIVTGYC